MQAKKWTVSLLPPIESHLFSAFWTRLSDSQLISFKIHSDLNHGGFVLILRTRYYSFSHSSINLERIVNGLVVRSTGK